MARMVLSKFFRRFGRDTPAPDAATSPPAITAPPRLLGLSMLKNEQDIVEPFLRHNARFLDALVVMDNASVDRTREIALGCARDLGNVVVCDSEQFRYDQSQRMTRLLHACQGAFFADYVLFLDADEFISAPDRPALEHRLDAIPPGGVGRMAWRTFVILPGQERSAGEDPPRSFTHRRASEEPSFHKAALRLDGCYMPDLVVTQGNHDVVRDGESLPWVALDDLPLLHFPVRSAAQIASKAVVGWAACLARDPALRIQGEAFQWREAFDRVRDGGADAILDGLPAASAGYAQTGAAVAAPIPEAPPADYARHHSDGSFSDPLSLVARSWERSLAPSAPVLELRRPAGALTASGTASTAFDAAWHWDHLFLDVAPFRYVAEKHQPVSVLDIGCGIGQYLALFKACGARSVLGVDGVPEEATRGVVAPDEYVVGDLARPLDLGRGFDLVVCVEVAEHLAAEDAEVLLDSIAGHAERLVVFSAAEPGQPGHGHINCRPLSHWLEAWARRGWVPDLADSLGMRALATMSWFRRNLVLLRRAEAVPDGTAAEVLAAIADRPFRWYAQSPGIRHLPFLEPPPADGEGYASAAAPGALPVASG